jgi:hypothetical protein
MLSKSGMIGIALAAGLLAACSSDKEPRLMNLRSTTAGPDEFSIVPTKPLQMPPDLAALPAPVPGGANLADPTPEADAVAALGGKATYLSATSIPGADGGLVNYAARFGTNQNIRSELAAADLEHRRANDGRLLEKLFKKSIYFKAYRDMALDQEAELERWRKVGVRTPAAPPNGAAQDASR